MSRPMKDSGVEWLGEVPESWNNKKIYSMFKIIGSGTTPKTSHTEFYDNGTIDWLNTGDLNNGYIIETKNKISELALNGVSALKMYPKDSLVVAMYGATIGKLGITKIPVATNQACCVLAEPMNADLKFIFYWLMGNQKEIVALGYGGGQPNISQKLIKNLRIPCPDVSEQQKIANFLDEKTAQIDSIIADTKQSVIEFKKYKLALISETVSRGLNLDAKMKDSGIEWVREIPEHWRATKIRNLCYLQSGKNLISEEIESEGSFPVYGGNGIRGYYHDFNRDGFHILIGRQGALCGNINLARGQFWATEHAIVVENKGFVDVIYFSYLLQSMNLNQYSQTAAQPGLAVGQLNNLKTILPPLVEQRQIADFLDGKCAHIESLIADKETLIREFEDYKKALIYEYVTGKKEVE